MNTVMQTEVYGVLLKTRVYGGSHCLIPGAWSRKGKRKPQTHPHQISILFDSQANKSYLCAGSVIYKGYNNTIPKVNYILYNANYQWFKPRKNKHFHGFFTLLYI